jgi:hypothetical protein
MPLDALGDLVLQVGADLSPLEDTLQSIPAVAQTAGAAIDSALGNALDGATASLNSLNTALSDVGAGAGGGLAELDAAVKSAGDSAGEAAPHIEDLGASTHHASDAAKEAEGSLRDMGEALKHLGEALLIAEGLRELATEALHAFDNVQKATIAITALTGSAKEADDQIERLKVLAQTDALSFPALLTAQTRMDALGFSSQQSSMMMQLAADSAKTMGKDFLTVVDQMDRMISSGAVMPRTLAGIGTSAQALGDIMGVAASEVTKAFKLLDDPTRGEVLQAALIKTRGIAEREAGLLSGQIQKMANAWDFMMEDVGKSLAGAFIPFTQFITSDVIPAIEKLAEWFGQLPASIQDFTIALTSLTVVAGLAAAAIGVIAITLAPVSPVLIAVGAAAVVLGAAFVALEQTSPEFRAAVSAVADQFSRLLESLKEVGTMALPLVQVAARNLADNLTDFVRLVGQVSQALNTLIEYGKQFAAWVESFIPRLGPLGSALETVAGFLSKMSSSMLLFGGAGPAITGLEALGRALGVIPPAAAAASQYTGKLADDLDREAQASAKAEAAARSHAQAQIKAAQDRAAAEKAAADAEAEAQKRWVDEQNDYLKAQTLADQALSNIKRDITDSAVSYQGLNDQILLSSQKLTPIEQLMAAMQKDIDAARSHWEVLDAAGQRHVTDLEAVVAQYAKWDEITKQMDLSAQLDKAHGYLVDIKSTMSAFPFDFVKNGMASITQGIKDAEAPTKQWEADMKLLGDRTDELKKGLDASLGAMARAIDSGRISTEQLDLDWAHLLSKFKDSADAQQQIIDKMQAEGAATELIYQAQLNMLAAQYKNAALHDQDASVLLKIREQMVAIGVQQGADTQLAETYLGTVKAISASWDSLAKGIGDAIVSGQNFGQVMTNVLDSLKKSIAELVVKYLMGELKDALLQNTNLLSDFNKAFNFVFGAGGTVEKGFEQAASAASDMATSIGNSATNISTDMSDVSSAVTRDGDLLKGEFQSLGDSINNFSKTSSDATQQAAASIHASAASMVADFNLIATVVAAIASIFSAIELMHTNTLLTRIEESTRRMDITMEGIMAQAAQVTIEQLPLLQLLYHLESMDVNFTSLLGDISATAAAMLQILEIIAANGGGGGQGGSGANNDAIIAAINAAAAKTAGMMGQLMSEIVTAGSAGTVSGGYSTIINSAGAGGPGASLVSGTIPLTATSGSNLGPLIQGLINQAKSFGAINDINAKAADLETAMQAAGLSANVSARALLEGPQTPEAPVDMALTHTNQLALLQAMLKMTTDIGTLSQQFQGTTISTAEFKQTVDAAKAAQQASADAALKAATALDAASQSAFNQQQQLDKAGQGFATMNVQVGNLMFNLRDFASQVYGSTNQFTSLTNAVSQFSTVQSDILYRTAEALGNLPGAQATTRPSGFALQTQAQIDAATKAGTNILAHPTASGASVYGSNLGGITINIGGSVVGVPQLADTVGNAIVDKLRRAGMKF